ncbi:hypothetical protein CCAX7_40810 [Capsulimonas corticalis]|uniref:Uncharacterized protein n=1 Tax=Capsulimonas corticalis TaxID=2219043 RepID=A0A402D6A8_9BACT|nr:GH116 family glycosyl-hydrolase [Capsulimonas corticalis]BDI32030.1 hypothetical protein CCAX7_40810 [Capsulimonas corticalis]
MVKLRTLLGVLSLPIAAAGIASAAPVNSFEPATGTIVDKRWQSGLPLGGIGVGKIELMTDGSFGNFTNQHNWDRPYAWAKGAFAAIRVKSAGGEPVARMLRLKSDGEYAGVDNVAHTRMQGWFPRAQIDYSDAALPVKVRLNAFSPLIPHNAKDSGLPIACLDYVVTNTSDKSVSATVALAWPNLLGWGGKGGVSWDDLTGNSQAPAAVGALTGLRYTTTQKYDDQHQNVLGEDFVSVRKDAGVDVSTCSAWDAGAATPSFWSDFASSGTLPPAAPGAAPQPAGAVAASVTLAPGETRTLHYYVVWAMPNLLMVNPIKHYTGAYDESPARVPSLTEQNPERWTTNRGMHTGDSLVIDLGKVLTPTEIDLKSGEGASPSDYPRGMKVEVSTDGSAWTTVADKTKEEMFESLAKVALTPTAGRYVRLTNEGDDGLFWSIYGLGVRVQEQDALIDPTNVTARMPHADLTIDNVQAGHYWQNYWSDGLKIADYADKNADRLLKETRAWQDPVLKSDVPFWLKLKLINCAFPMFSNTVLTKNGEFSVLESPIEMGGALGTMDQRMAAHAFLTAFFPELDRAELEQYAQCQQPDGRITHFDGNVHVAMVNPNVNYGITDWPDLSTSWISQSVKLYRWTGDKSFLDRVHPHIASAMEWLRKDGADYEYIPAGGSTYDYETLPRGQFIYSASCYLGALRAASAISDPAEAAKYDKTFANVQASVMKNLWTGTYFRKWKQPSTGRTVDDSFIANLAGDWMTRISGLPTTLDAKIVHQSVAQTMARHQKPFFPMPPMQVTTEGKITTSACYSLQHEPYLGCEAIYDNYVDDGMETIRRMYFSIWEENNSPWDESLCYDASSGRKGGLPTYMTCPTSWFVLDALAGTSIDVPNGRLYVSPRLTSAQTELHIPVYLSRFWGWLDYVPAAHKLTLKIDKVFGPNAELQKSLYHLASAKTDEMPETVTIRSVAASGDAQPIALATPFTVKEGAVLDLSSQIDRLAIPKHTDVVNFEVRAKINRPGLPAERWTLTDNLHDNPQLAAIIGQDALDGNPESRWTTGRGLQAGDSFTLDMGAAQKVAKMVLDDSKFPGDYPEGYQLEGSTDGKAWSQIAQATPQETEAAVQNGVLTINFTPTEARYLRVTSTGAHSLWWSVAEISVDAP